MVDGNNTNTNTKVDGKINNTILISHPSTTSRHMVFFDIANGYAFNILTYFGSDTSYNPAMSDFGTCEKIFDYLLSPLCSGHHVFADRFYTTYSLLQYLTDKKYFYTGTVQCN